MQIQTAQFEIKFAWLFQDFGRDYACKVFGMTANELETLVGRFSKGNHKGELRGVIEWRRVIKGGWVRTGHGAGQGFVVREPGKKYAHRIVLKGSTLKGLDVVDGMSEGDIFKRDREHQACIAQSRLDERYPLAAFFRQFEPASKYGTPTVTAKQQAGMTSEVIQIRKTLAGVRETFAQAQVDHAGDESWKYTFEAQASTVEVMERYLRSKESDAGMEALSVPNL